MWRWLFWRRGGVGGIGGVRILSAICRILRLLALLAWAEVEVGGARVEEMLVEVIGVVAGEEVEEVEDEEGVGDERLRNTRILI